MSGSVRLMLCGPRRLLRSLMLILRAVLLCGPSTCGWMAQEIDPQRRLHAARSRTDGDAVGVPHWQRTLQFAQGS